MSQPTEETTSEPVGEAEFFYIVGACVFAVILEVGLIVCFVVRKRRKARALCKLRADTADAETGPKSDTQEELRTFAAAAYEDIEVPQITGPVSSVPESSVPESSVPECSVPESGTQEELRDNAAVQADHATAVAVRLERVEDLALSSVASRDETEDTVPVLTWTETTPRTAARNTLGHTAASVEDESITGTADPSLNPDRSNSHVTRGTSAVAMSTSRGAGYEYIEDPGISSDGERSSALQIATIAVSTSTAAGSAQETAPPGHVPMTENQACGVGANPVALYEEIPETTGPATNAISPSRHAPIADSLSPNRPDDQQVDGSSGTRLNSNGTDSANPPVLATQETTQQAACHMTENQAYRRVTIDATTPSTTAMQEMARQDGAHMTENQAYCPVTIDATTPSTTAMPEMSQQAGAHMTENQAYCPVVIDATTPSTTVMREMAQQDGAHMTETHAYSPVTIDSQAIHSTMQPPSPAVARRQLPPDASIPPAPTTNRGAIYIEVVDVDVDSVMVVHQEETQQPAMAVMADQPSTAHSTPPTVTEQPNPSTALSTSPAQGNGRLRTEHADPLAIPSPAIAEDGNARVATSLTRRPGDYLTLY